MQQSAKETTAVYLHDMGRTNGFIARKLRVTLSWVEDVLAKADMIRQRDSDRLKERYLAAIELRFPVQ